MYYEQPTHLPVIVVLWLSTEINSRIHNVFLNIDV